MADMTRERQLALAGYHGFGPPDESKRVRGVDLGGASTIGYRNVGLDEDGGERAQAATPSTDDLQAMTKGELAALADSYGLNVKPSGKRRVPLKKDYVKALSKALGG